jgi:hypothetical protein
MHYDRTPQLLVAALLLDDDHLVAAPFSSFVFTHMTTPALTKGYGNHGNGNDKYQE